MQKRLFPRTRALASFRNNFSFPTLLILTVLLVLSATLFAQTTGSVSGTVTDQSGAVIGGAKVTLLNQGTGILRDTESNQVGRFTFAGVQPGTYTVKVAADKFKNWQRPGFVLNGGDTREVDGIKMEVGSSGETVTVEASTSQIDLVTNGERSSVLSSVDIDKMALVSRNVTELLKVLPGVSSVATSGSNNQGFNFTTASPTGSPIGAGLSTNGAPYRGGAMLLLDGANIIDPGCNCWSTAVPNPEFTQEVKVTTSNFSVDQPNGPVVFTAVSKSGGNAYHGSAYFNARNNAMNSRTWADAHNNNQQPDEAWYYPGGTFGGPVPGTKGKLMAWGGYEYYWQKLPGGAITSWVPTPAMRAGNFSSTDPANAAYCAAVGGFSPSRNDACQDLTGTILPNGTALTGSQIPASAIDPNMARLMNAYFPQANADPSNGYNYYLATSGQQNGWVWRTRVDYNINDSNKFYISYQEGSATGFQPAHFWWTPNNSVPFPGGGITNPTKTKTVSANFLHVFGPTMTNEMILSWNKSTSPYVPNDINAAYRSTIGWTDLTVFSGGHNDLMAPNVYSPRNRTFPEMSQPNVFSVGGEFGLTKAAPSFQENLTKVYKNHTFKMGFFYTMVGNYQGNFTYPNGVLSFDSLNTTSETSAYSVTNQLTGAFYGSQNPMANFLMGVATGYQEASALKVSDMAYRTYSFYGMDDWKVTKRLTVNYGLRFDHVGRWYERTGTGMAVWLPDLYQSDVAANRIDPGVRWHGIDPGIPLSGTQSKALFMSPRLGFSLDLFGTGKTVVRGGWGAYRWGDQWNDYSGALTTAQGVQTFNLTNNKSILVSQITPSLNVPVSGPVQSGSIYATDPHDVQVPLTYAYNFTISQQLPWRSLLEVAYVGNSSSNLLMGGQSGGAGIGGADFINRNKIPLGGLFGADPVTGAAAPANPDATSTYNQTDYFPYYQGYGSNSIAVGEHVGYSNYNAFQVAWVKQGSNFTANLNYTYSKALGIVNATVDPFTVHGNYGVLNIDRPHVFNASYSYDLGKIYKGNSVLQHITNNWSIAGITTFQSGANLQSVYSNQNLGINLNSNGLTTRSYYGTSVGMILPVYTCDPARGLAAQQYININCVSAPALGQYGDRQAPYLAGPAFFNQDMSLRKEFGISERQKVQFSLNVANVFNHPNWYINGGNMGTLNLTGSGSSWTPNSGQSTYGTANLKDGQRLIMLGLKYSF